MALYQVPGLRCFGGERKTSMFSLSFTNQNHSDVYLTTNKLFYNDLEGQERRGRCKAVAEKGKGEKRKGIILSFDSVVRRQ